MPEHPLAACEVAVPPGAGVRGNDAQDADAQAFAQALRDLRGMPAWNLIEAEVAQRRVDALGDIGKARTSDELRTAQAGYRATFILDGVKADATRRERAAEEETKTRIAERLAIGAVSDDDVPHRRMRMVQFTGDEAMTVIERARQIAEMVKTPAWRLLCQRLAALMFAHYAMGQTCEYGELEYHRHVVSKLGHMLQAVQNEIDRGTDAAIWLRTEAEARRKE